MTSYIFLWEESSGERRWEVTPKEQTTGFLESLLKKDVSPATIMVAYAPIMFHWVWKKLHNGLSDVNFHKINDEIYGTEFVEKRPDALKDIPIEHEKRETKYGWIATDGRFFGCEYGAHSSLARQIVGEINDVKDPELFLEEIGWAKILSGRYNSKRYTVGMGIGKKLTGLQLKTIQYMGLEDAHGVLSLL